MNLLQKIFRHPWYIIALFCAITLFLGWQIPKLTIDNSVESSLADSHPVKKLKNEMEAIFGENEKIMVAFHTPGQSIFTPERIRRIADLTNALEKTGHVAKVDSLINMDYLTGEKGGIRTEPLVSRLPENESDIAALKAKLQSWEIYRGVLYSEDEQATMILVELQKGEKYKRQEAFQAIQQLAKQYSDPQTQIYVAGEEAVTILITQQVKGDIFKLLPFVLVSLLLILYLAFRKPGGVILPTLTVGMSCIWTVGFMAWWGFPFSVMSSAIPILMVAVGSAYGIHYLSHYYDDLAEQHGKQEMTAEKHREIVLETLHKIGQPIFLAGITTMAGFGSLASSALTMVRNFGTCTAFGVAMAMLITIFFIPALLLLRHKALSVREAPRQAKPSLLNAMLLGVYHYFTRHHWMMLGLSTAIVIVSVIGIDRVTIGQPLIRYFKAHTEVRQADEFINQHFNGSTVLSVVVEGMPIAQAPAAQDAGPGGDAFEDDFAVPDAAADPAAVTEDDFAVEGEAAGGPDADRTPALDRKSVRDPELLKQLDGLQPYLEAKFPEVKQVASFAQMVKRMNQVMHEGDPAFNEIPYAPEKYGKKDREALKRLIAQYLLLYSGNLDQFIDNMDDPKMTRMTIQMREAHPQFIKKVKAAVLEYGRQHIEPLGYSVKTTGAAEIILAVTEQTIHTQIKSILIAMVLVFGVVAWYLRSWLAGLFATVPLAISLLINFGIMGYFGIPLDVGTALIASVTIGIGMDYSIHFIASYYRQLRQTRDLEQVNRRTLLSTGKAIAANAFSVAAGFAVLTLSSFNPLIFFGVLVALTMFTSSFASMTVLPVLLNLFKPKVGLRSNSGGNQ